MKRKPKPTIEIALMREACQELNEFTEWFFDSRDKSVATPERLFWIAVKYADAYKRHSMGKKGGPF